MAHSKVTTMSTTSSGRVTAADGTLDPNKKEVPLGLVLGDIGLAAAAPYVVEGPAYAVGASFGSALAVFAPALAGLTAAEITIDDARTVRNTWKDAEKDLDGIKPDTQHQANLQVMERVLHTELGEKSGVSRNADGQYQITNPMQLSEALMTRKAELEKAVKTNSSVLPTWLDMTDGQRENRSNEFSAEERLRRVNAAGVELSDLTQKQVVAQQANAAAQDAKHIVKGGTEVKNNIVASVGGGAEVERQR